MFLFGLFLTLGFSPQSVIFQTLIDLISPFISYAALIALLVLAYFVYDSIYSPVRDLFRGLKANGVIGLMALILALFGGMYFLVNLGGFIVLLLSIVFWKAAVRFY